MAIILTTALLARQHRPEQPELSRKIVHIGMGAVIPLAWYFDIPAVVAIPFAVVVTLGTAINHRWRMIPAGCQAWIPGRDNWYQGTRETQVFLTIEIISRRLSTKSTDL